MTLTKSELDYLSRGIIPNTITLSKEDIIQELVTMLYDWYDNISEAYAYVDKAQDALKDLIYDCFGDTKKDAEKAEELVSQARTALGEINVID